MGKRGGERRENTGAQPEHDEVAELGGSTIHCLFHDEVTMKSRWSHDEATFGLFHDLGIFTPTLNLSAGRI